MKRFFISPVKAAFLSAIFLNAFVDLGHKIIIQNTIFKIYDGQTQLILTALINGLILLPYIALLSPAGFVADRFAKHSVLRIAAIAAVVLTMGITLCYYMGWFWPAFGMTFLLAIQSAFYAPAKFGYLKPLYGKENLAQGNGAAQATVIVAILSGTLAYSLFFESLFSHSATTSSAALLQIAPLGWLLIITAIIELVMVLKLPPQDEPKPKFEFNWQHYRSGKLLRENVSAFWQRDIIRLSIIGLSVFWALGQLMLAAFPTYAETRFGMHNTFAIQSVMACSAIGIAIGSGIAARSSKNHIEVGLIPLGAIGICASLLLLPQAHYAWSQALCFLGMGIGGGLFIVPLNAMIQFTADEQHLGRTLASSFWVQNIAMTSILAMTVAAAYLHISSQTLLYIAAAIAVIGCAYTVYKLSFSLTRIMASLLLGQRYHINVQGLSKLPGHGGVLLLGNHVSWLDWAIVQIACPRKVRFVMINRVYNLWYLKWFFKLNGCIPISGGTSSANALQKVAQALDNGEVVCLFPEGTFSRTGQLGVFKRGFERACEQLTTPVNIVPFYIRGLWGSQFSMGAKGTRQQRNTRLKRTVIFGFGDTLPHTTKADALKRRVFDLSISSWNHYAKELPTLGEAFIRTAKQRQNLCTVIDGDTTLNRSQLFVVSALLAQHMRKHNNGEFTGLMLPASAGNIAACLATFMAGKKLLPVNYTASLAQQQSALNQTNTHVLYTSRRFIKKLTQRGLAAEELLANYTVFYLEDVLTGFSTAKKLLHLALFYTMPTPLLLKTYLTQTDPEQTAAVLFSSGSEGEPKGVMLSHRNFMANIEQVSDVINPQRDDMLLASLPPFHAFGLTVTQLLPVIEGIPVCCYADPTDGLGLAKCCAQNKATIMFGTATFFNLYARNKRIHPLMFSSLRYIIAGAERLSSDVAEVFKLKYSKTIMEGYGTTETTPVASVNLPDHIDELLRVHPSSKVGTVGMPLPGASFKVIDPSTHEELPTGKAGMVLIGGAHVMQGYYNKPELSDSVLLNLHGERWYITGDKGYLDADGFLSIVDRYSRFAKIGGEMVSLSAVEQALKPHITNDKTQILAMAVPDAKKGETIIVLYSGELNEAELKAALNTANIAGLMQPKRYVKVDEIPLLGSGKTDFTSAKRIALALA